MLRFKVKDKPVPLIINGYTCLEFQIIQIEPEVKEIAQFIGSNSCDVFMDNEIVRAMAYDYCDFLNEKYIDKEINAEWGKADREARINYYENQIKILKTNKYGTWNSDGTGYI